MKHHDIFAATLVHIEKLSFDIEFIYAKIMLVVGFQAVCATLYAILFAEGFSDTPDKKFYILYP